MKERYLSIIMGFVGLLAATFLLYRFFARTPASALPAERLSDGSRLASTTIQYMASTTEEAAHFILIVDNSGSITNARTVDPQTLKASPQQAAFTVELTKVIKGRKLSELGALDKVGKSSLTTEAFNEAIPILQAEVAAVK